MWYKAPNPAFNGLLSNCIYSDIPTIDGGETCAQVFFGRRTHVGDAYKMKSESEFPNTLQRNIRDRGAPDRLLTDSATYETSKRVNAILNDLHIGAWQSEEIYFKAIPNSAISLRKASPAQFQRTQATTILCSDWEIS
jgi:hypothetical protein